MYIHVYRLRFITESLQCQLPFLCCISFNVLFYPKQRTSRNSSTILQGRDIYYVITADNLKTKTCLIFPDLHLYKMAIIVKTN